MLVSQSPPAPERFAGNLRLRYVWGIAFVAAMGGLLFGYDWVVIGGAKPFYESYFDLKSASAAGWANSCALLGCFAGSLLAGTSSDRYGRKKVLIFSAFLFTLSSVLTGWAYSFHAFIAWRIIGGVAIGLASNVSPMYIAEISPSIWRGRLVSLNQLAIVLGILFAQVSNWQIAQRVPEHISKALLAASWNVQCGWRWMFTAVAVPALLFLIATPFIPESPRWLAATGRKQSAAHVLTHIGGRDYSEMVLNSIESNLATFHTTFSWGELLERPARKLLLIGVSLAVLQQASGINVLFNYAADVYRSAGYGVSEVLFNIVITGAINLLFTLVAMLLIDRLGRRLLMILGCVGVGLSHLAASFAFRLGLQGPWVLMLTLCAIGCYAMSLAPVTWVLITEIFPNRMRASAVSVSIAALWVSSFVLTYMFPILDRFLGSAGTFLVYGSICLVGAVFVFLAVPETKGISLEQGELPARESL